MPSGFGKPHPHHGHPTPILLLLQVEPIIDRFPKMADRAVRSAREERVVLSARQRTNDLDVLRRSIEPIDLLGVQAA